MNNPWKVLQIEPTTDPEEIKKAYRALAQRYHPDKAKTPEKERKYTVRFVEIRRAYEAAMQYAEYQAATPGKATPASTSWARSGGAVSWREWVKAAFVLAAGAVGIVLLVAIGIYARSFPESHLFPIAFFVVVGICVGYFVGFLLFGLLMLLYTPIQFGILEKIGLGKYADKLGWALSVLLWLFVISLIGVSRN